MPEWDLTRDRFSFELLLTCGCSIRCRDIPRKNAFLSCRSGKGHGHKVRWVRGKCHETGRDYTNDTV